MEQAIFLKNNIQHFDSKLHFDFCGVSKTFPFHAFGPSVRSNYILHIVLAGKGVYHVKDKKFTLKKGDLFLIRPGESTFYLADGSDPWIYCWLSFGGPEVDQIMEQSPFKENQYTLTSNKSERYLALILECLSYNQETRTDELKLTALVYRFLAELLADGGSPQKAERQKYSPIAIEAIKYIEKNYEQSLIVGDVAKELAVDRSHLSRIFHEHVGMPIKQYILAVQINRAAYLLSMTNESIELIAEKVGFKSLVVFSRSFKKLTGETASAYRKRMNADEFTIASLDQLNQQLEQQMIVRRAT